MDQYKVTAGEINRLLKSQAEKSRLIIPIEEGEQVELKEFRENDNPSLIVDSFRPYDPLKTFLMSPFEEVATFPEKMSEIEAPNLTLFGFKACSTNHIRLLDEIMLDDEWPDVFYRKRRENLFIISCDCVEVRDTCFCTEVGLKPYPTTGNFDLNISHLNDQFIITVGSEEGHRALAEASLNLQEISDEIRENLQEQRQEITERVKNQNDDYGIDEKIHEPVRENRDAGVFAEKAEDCVECGGCNLVCSSCYCFYLADREVGEEAFRRFRVWDSCQYNAYARVAGDETPRPMLMQRIRHRIAHKFDYLKESFDYYGCVGCGRCISACPADIDIRELLQGVQK